MTAPTDLGPWGERRAERLEDLTFMAEHGENAAGAAQRLELSVETLERWCMRHAPHLWQQLAANQHKPGYIPAGTVTQPTRKQGIA